MPHIWGKSRYRYILSHLKSAHKNPLISHEVLNSQPTSVIAQKVHHGEATTANQLSMVPTQHLSIIRPKTLLQLMKMNMSAAILGRGFLRMVSVIWHNSMEIQWCHFCLDYYWTDKSIISTSPRQQRLELRMGSREDKIWRKVRHSWVICYIHCISCAPWYCCVAMSHVSHLYFYCFIFQFTPEKGECHLCCLPMDIWISPYNNFA